ncbi:MAG TPA: pyroglutamyl-peptidase I [Pirellulales bacterium]|jgi:pyroglutamyl-peptidase|nr:pyroglutamyl-peptidase I [Pirellulales bacterium]
MTSVLITAFEPYDRWQANSSWLCLMELTRDRPTQPAITTRRYPVDFQAAKERLAQDLKANYDYALHLGQAPRSATIRLEEIGLNVGGGCHEPVERLHPLAADGPTAYRTSLPLGDWSAKLRQAGIPSQVSYHAGTYLCNAMLYWSHYLSEQLGLRTRSAFIHLPLDISQTLGEREELPSLPAGVSAAALRLILNELHAGGA